MTSPGTRSAARAPTFAWSDGAALLFLAAVTWMLAIYAAPYQRLSAAHPYLIAFVVFAVLSTFGEAISARMSTGRWGLDRPVARAALWGAIGAWIAAAFPLEAAGVAGLADAGLWPGTATAFSISLWTNLLSGYGLFMMLTHRWASVMIDGRRLPPWRLFAEPGFADWSRVVLLSLVLFWLPAHTITFLLPAGWRTVFAAYLGIALGIILTTAGRRPVATPPNGDHHG